MHELKPGKYRHYKGHEYELIGVGKDTETLEDVVLYRALRDDPEFGPRPFWVRPLKMFLENVHVHGKETPRFTFIGEK